MVLLGFFILSFISGLTVFLYGLKPLQNKALVKIVTIIFAFILLSLDIYAWMHIEETELDYFTFDKLGVLLLSILSLLTFTTIYHGFIYLKDETPKRFAIYHSALIALIVAMAGAYLANGVIVVWIFVEATTLSVVALIYHDRTESSLEAAWKYFFVCSIGITLAYIGILFLGFTTGGTDILQLSFSELSKISISAEPLYLKIAFIFIFVGYSTKMGLFPMHTVTIDAHSVSPPPISAFISTTLMNVGFIAIFRVYTLFSTTIQADTHILQFMNNLLILSGLLSLLIASGYMLKAKHNKRMLAYSSLENMGIVAIAVGIGGIAYYAAILHIVLHSLTKAGLFYQIGQSRKILGTYMLDDSGNYLKLYPAGAGALMLGIICIVAIPPSGLFISEFMLFKAMVNNGEYFYLIVTTLLLSFVLYALIVRVLHILFSEPRKTQTLVNPNDRKINSNQTVSQFILFGMVIYICFSQPQFLQDTINSIILNLSK
jgi:hydrogenase-4 component F